MLYTYVNNIYIYIYIHTYCTFSSGLCELAGVGSSIGGGAKSDEDLQA